MVRRGRHVASLESRGSTFVHSARGLWEKTWVCARRVSPPLKRVSLHHSCGLAHDKRADPHVKRPPSRPFKYVCMLLARTFELLRVRRST